MPSLTSILDYSSYFTANGFRAGAALKNIRDLSSGRFDLTKNLGLNPDLLAIPEQVHSGRVIKIDSPGRYGNIDGLVTLNKKIVLSIQTADCVPIFLFDKNTQIFGLVHAGWRGTLLGIAGKTIKIFIKYGADPANIQVLLGPSIGQCCFETGPDVWKKFPEEFLLKGKKDRYYIDLSGSIKAEFLAGGLKPDLISSIRQCTFCGVEKFPSFRRDGANAGRMAVVCGWVYP